MGYSTVTTVVTAAKSYDLVDLQTVKDELAIGDNKSDTWLKRQITWSSKAAANYCNRVFVVETVQDVIDLEQDPFPYQTPGRIAPLILSRWPVTSLTSVQQQINISTLQTLVQDTDFRLDADRGDLMRLNPFTGVAVMWEPVPVTVEYAAGYATIPGDVQDAVCRLIRSRWFARGRDPLLKSDEVAGLGRQEFWVSAGTSGNMTPDVADLLDNYRVPVAI